MSSIGLAWDSHTICRANRYAMSGVGTMARPVPKARKKTSIADYQGVS